MKLTHIISALALVSNSMAATLVFSHDTTTILDGKQDQQTVLPPAKTTNESVVAAGNTGNSAIALQISGIKQTSGSNKQAIAFFDVVGGGYNYDNLYGFAYELKGTSLTIYTGGFNQAGSYGQQWDAFTISNFSENSTLSLFYNYSSSNTVKTFHYAVDGGSIINSNSSYTGGFKFSSTYVDKITLGDLNTTSGDGTWASNGGGGTIGAIDKGEFTFDYINGYYGNLTDSEMQNLAMQAIPEPASSAFIGFGFAAMLLRRRRKQA